MTITIDESLTIKKRVETAISDLQEKSNALQRVIDNNEKDLELTELLTTMTKELNFINAEITDLKMDLELIEDRLKTMGD